MRYVQERSFIATFLSTTPGYSGYLDSVEGLPRTRRNNWLTLTSPFSAEPPQRFWLGYFEGRDAGYQVRTLESAPGDSHHAIWDLSFSNSIGFYVSSTNPVLWRVRVDDAKLQVPEQRTYRNVTLAAPGKALLSVATRDSWDDHYVGIKRPNPLTFTMDVLEVGCALFDSHLKFRRR
ncbi:hypothetical protein [Pseudomonas muyukensis]|uniref:Uncharacterized protein n=1 Tax=Pseudomonas muyukensis TaxID=2842357 RepID=A0ABX8M9I2_9PSED|nr:hypothetical protein [Pseudomonas muyukensis]QXH34991.1 hypothetical protein KSS95_23120 [Pseudomonas muyukensis]